MSLLVLLPQGGLKPLGEKRLETSDNLPVSRVRLVSNGRATSGLCLPGRAASAPDRCQSLVPVLPESESGCSAAGRMQLLFCSSRNVITSPDEFCELPPCVCPNAPAVRA